MTHGQGLCGARIRNAFSVRFILVFFGNESEGFFTFVPNGSKRLLTIGTVTYSERVLGVLSDEVPQCKKVAAFFRFILKSILQDQLISLAG